MRKARGVLLIALSLASLYIWSFILSTPPTQSGVTFSPSTTIYSPQTPKVAVWFGDSFGAGTGSTDLSHSFVSIVSRTFGLYEENLSQGGTGYLGNGTGKREYSSACGTFPYGNYLLTLKKNACLRADYIFVTGGRNDNWSPLLAKQIEDFYYSLHVRFPNSKIIAFGPLFGLEAESEDALKFKTAVRSSVLRNGGYYVDLGEPLNGDARLLWKDQFHPNDAAMLRSLRGSLPV